MGPPIPVGKISAEVESPFPGINIMELKHSIIEPFNLGVTAPDSSASGVAIGARASRFLTLMEAMFKGSNNFMRHPLINIIQRMPIRGIN
jgi:hypothetical protein